MTRAELVEMVAQKLARLAQRSTSTWDEDARELLSAIEAAGLILADRKLLAEAHACMRETGWHLATCPLADGSDQDSDGVLETACSDVEARMRAMLSASPLAPEPTP